MEVLPLEIIGCKIFNQLFKDRDFNVKNFFGLQFLNKYLYSVVNSPVILQDMCRIKNIHHPNIKSLSVKELKSLIINRLYLHKFNIGRHWLPNNMFGQPDNDDFNNSSITTNFNGIFEKIEIKDSNGTIVLSVTNEEKKLYNLSLKIERHVLFDGIYAIYFNLNNIIDPLFWTNLNDYKIKILGIVY